MREVVDGVFEVDYRFVHAYLVVVDQGLVLVDTGLPKRADAVTGLVAELGRKPEDLHTILVTHRHGDHVGSLAELARRTGARVLVHALDVPVVTGAAGEPAKGLLRKALLAVLPKPEPATVDDTVTDGTEPVPGFRAVHTPGHTPGHTSFLLDRAGGVLFVGDAAAGRRNGVVSKPPALMSDDMVRAAASIRRIAELDFDTACFGHGRVLRGGATDRFRALASTLR
jgi:glyoxylase-like metal-dependent hydrolase (beta-lactamase superfamily II)